MITVAGSGRMRPTPEISDISKINRILGIPHFRSGLSRFNFESETCTCLGLPVRFLPRCIVPTMGGKKKPCQASLWRFSDD